jgi:hypothetical protein
VRGEIFRATHLSGGSETETTINGRTSARNSKDGGGKRTEMVGSKRGRTRT